MRPISKRRNRRLQGIPAAMPAIAGPLSPSPAINMTDCNQKCYYCRLITNNEIRAVSHRQLCYTWTNSVDLRRLSIGHTSFGDDLKPVGQLGIKEKDIRTPGRTRFLLDCAIYIWAAFSQRAIAIFAQKVWSFHLDVEPFAKSHTILFCSITIHRWNQSILADFSRFQWSMLELTNFIYIN